MKGAKKDMFLFNNIDLIFILSFAFLAALIIIWILTIIIVKKYKQKNKKPIDYASKNVHFDSEEKTEENEIKEYKVTQEESVASDSENEDNPEPIVVAPVTENEETPLETEENNEEVSEEPKEEAPTEEIKEDTLEPVEATQAEEKAEKPTDNEVVEEAKEDVQEAAEPEKVEEAPVENNDEVIVETQKDEEPVIEEPKFEEEIVTETQANEESTEDTPALEEPKEEAPVEEEPQVEKKKINAVPVKKGRTYNGKFEIFEAGDGYAYQLKASNGEILVVSETYSSRDSVIKAIKAVQKNISDGEVKIFADKNNKYKFKLIAKNYKPLAISASYTVYKSAVRASESFKKYAMIADIVDVELDDKESKTATPIEITTTEDKDGAKFVVEKFDGEFSWALKASNGEILCQAEGYTSKAGCLYSIDTFKKNIVEGQFRCIKDKSGNYCYKLYTANNRICAVGESYSSKQNAISAANSVVAFYKNAKLEEKK